MVLLCHPFAAVVAGPTGCEKTAWVLRLIDSVREKIEPVPTRIWYYYSEHQPVFKNYPEVHFEDGLPQLNDEVFDGREPTMIVVDDHMPDVKQLVADIVTYAASWKSVTESGTCGASRKPSGKRYPSSVTEIRHGKRHGILYLLRCTT